MRCTPEGSPSFGAPTQQQELDQGAAKRGSGGRERLSGELELARRQWLTAMSDAATGGPARLGPSQGQSATQKREQGGLAWELTKG
jgi:hypothetical protein